MANFKLNHLGFYCKLYFFDRTIRKIRNWNQNWVLIDGTPCIWSKSSCFVLSCHALFLSKSGIVNSFYQIYLKQIQSPVGISSSTKGGQWQVKWNEAGQESQQIKSPPSPQASQQSWLWPFHEKIQNSKL